MSIHFSCEHCGRKLRTRSRRAGARAECPGCRQAISVPQASTVTAPQAANSFQFAPGHASTHTPSGEPVPPPPVDKNAAGQERIVVVDTDEDDDLAGDSYSAIIVDPHRVAVPRSVIYLNSVLLLTATLGCFAFGYFVGRGMERRRSTQADDASPRLISGRVTYADEGGQRLPDAGAVIIVVREDERPQLDEKVNSSGLRPADPLPDARHSEVIKLGQLGGAYARTDDSGEFRLRLPIPGRYFMLAISHHGRRTNDVVLSRTEFAQMSRLFSAPEELIADRKFRWLNESIVQDRRFVLVLE